MGGPRAPYRFRLPLPECRCSLACQLRVTAPWKTVIVSQLGVPTSARGRLSAFLVCHDRYGQVPDSVDAVLARVPGQSEHDYHRWALIFTLQALADIGFHRQWPYPADIYEVNPHFDPVLRFPLLRQLRVPSALINVAVSGNRICQWIGALPPKRPWPG